MPPRSVCLNVFTHSLGEGNGAVNNRNPMLERRDSAQCGMPAQHMLLHARTPFPTHDIDIGADIPRRTSDGTLVPPSAANSTSPPAAFNRADLFRSLRPMTSTESLNGSLTSKRKFYISRLQFEWGRDAGTRFDWLHCISAHVALHFTHSHGGRP